jgi:hypothetical protein
MIEIPSGLHKDAVPFAFLLGTWEGAGVFDFPGAQKCNFGQEIIFRHDGRPFIEYRSRTWALDGEGNRVSPLENEFGFWRVTSNAEGVSGARGVEVSMVRDEGVIEIWYGEMADGKPQIDIVTDAIARTPSAGPYSAGKRLYGLVGGELMWVGEKAAPEIPLRPYMSAQLKKVLNPARLIEDIADLPEDGIAFFR